MHTGKPDDHRILPEGEIELIIIVPCEYLVHYIKGKGITGPDTYKDPFFVMILDGIDLHSHSGFLVKEDGLGDGEKDLLC